MVINRYAQSTPSDLRRSHRAMILSMIESTPGISRAELSRSLGLSEMAATRIVRELLAAELVEEADVEKTIDKKKRNVGRPKTGLYVVADKLFAAGITVSAYYSEVSICDGLGSQVASRRLDAPPFNSAIGASNYYAKALKELIATSRIDINRIVGVGVALSARTKPEQGEIVTSEYFGWSNDGGAFVREIQKIIDLPVEIENISNALAIAEMRFGAAREASEFALVHVATFVGAGIVSERRIVRGVSGVSGLVGHFRSQETDLTCSCGNHNCLNLNATGFGLLSKLKKLDHKVFNTARVSLYASEMLTVLNDKSTSGAVAEAGTRLAPALDVMAKLLGPQMIVISGYLGSHQTYFDAVDDTLKREYGFDAEKSCQLVRGTIAADRCADLLALHTFGYSERLDFEKFSAGSDKGLMAHG